jgi:hypothetical protein
MGPSLAKSEAMSDISSKKRWQLKNPEAARAEKLRYYRQFQKNNRRRLRPWTKEEMKLITSRRRPCDRELSEKMGRSVQAIQQKRLDMKIHAAAPRRVGKL